MAEVFSIGKGINKYLESDNEHIKNTAEKMKCKFNKYWRNPDTINILRLIAFVLDPRVKLSIAEFYISLLYADSGKVDDLKKKLKSSLSELYAQYRGVDDSQSSQLDTPPNEDNDDNIFCHYSQETEHKFDLKSEIESYLQEARVPYNKGAEFDILDGGKPT
ncbi:uncharacterized protein LOC131617807 [Vicia villosa]|uniref:uncharacterized protein LOC131617807 n=1 Tax=Vicia villosa TaxID=3911 RepID=UPI00273B2C61|nr:uncharacterized protein LOC131617807 [Vicia villosa]